MQPITNTQFNFPDPGTLSGNLWDCVAIEPGKNGGCIRTYRSKADCNTSSKEDFPQIFAAGAAINLRIYPAAEPFMSWFTESKDFPQRTNPSDPGSVKINTRYENFLSDLGFCYWYDPGSDICHIQFPDREALLGSWAVIKEKYHIKHNLDIYPSEGTAGHLEFVKGVRDHDVVLSKNKEFVHDMFFHVLATLELIFNSPDFDNALLIRKGFIDEILQPLEALGQIQEKFAGRVSELPANIQNLLVKKVALEAMLGMYVDILASRRELKFIKSLDGFLENSGGITATYRNSYCDNIFKDVLPGVDEKNLFQTLKGLRRELKEGTETLIYSRL